MKRRKKQISIMHRLRDERTSTSLKKIGVMISRMAIQDPDLLEEEAVPAYLTTVDKYKGKRISQEDLYTVRNEAGDAIAHIDMYFLRKSVQSKIARK